MSNHTNTLVQMAIRLDKRRADEVIRLTNASGGSIANQLRRLVCLGLAMHRVKAEAIQTAERYELEAASGPKQTIRMPNRRALAALKGQHWRILAKMIEDAESSGEQG